MATPKRGFVLIPDHRTILEAVKLNKAFTANRLILDDSFTLPHLTVLQTNFHPGFDYEAALKELRSYRGFNFEPRSNLVSITKHSTSLLKDVLWWEVQTPEWLKTFNRELIHKYEHEIIKPEMTDELTFSSPEAEESYRRTGYERNLDAYEPHITLAVIDGVGAIPALPLAVQQIRFHRLAFVEHGDLGQLTKILATEDLPMAWD